MFLDKKSNFDVPHIKNNISQLRSLANKEPHIRSYLIIFFIREENLSLTKQGQYLLLSRALGNFPKYYLYLFSVIAQQNHHSSKCVDFRYSNYYPFLYRVTTPQLHNDLLVLIGFQPIATTATSSLLYTPTGLSRLSTIG
jgi:hypothetical protein